MSNYVFPSYLSGIAWPVKRSPSYSTHIQKSLSGKESRIALKQYPQYNYEMDINIARDDLSRTNMIYNSVNVTSCTFGTACTGVANIDLLAPDPDNTYTTVKVAYAGTGTAGQNIITYPVGSTVYATGTAFVASVWLRVASGTLALRLGIGQNAPTAVTLTTTWQRFTFTDTSLGATAPVLVVAMPSGVNTASTFYMWGPQLELGTVASGYIPTYSAAPVTVIDYRTLYALYSQMQGMWDTFLYLDPDWNSVTQQQFAVGDGSTRSFQLTGAWQPYAGSYTGYDIVQNIIPFSGIGIYVGGTIQASSLYTISSTGVVTFTTAPSAAAVVAWTGSFYHRCRFDTDDQEFSQMMSQWWEIKSLKFVVVKL